jgi:predicted transcriptional regulator
LIRALLTAPHPLKEITVPDDSESTVSLAATIVASYVSGNTIAPDEIGGLIQSVKAALDGSVLGTAEPSVQEPAHPLRRLVTSDAIFCAECGKKFKSLKRHLRTDHDLTPQAYRAKWGLKGDSPMVAPNYSATRSALAKSIGLGQFSKQAPPPPPPPVKQKAAARARPGKSAAKTSPK